MYLLNFKKLFFVFFIIVFAGISYLIFNEKHKSYMENKTITKEINDYIKVLYPVPATACRCMLIEFESNISDFLEISLKEKGITENDEIKVINFMQEVNEKFKNRIKVEKIKYDHSKFKIFYEDSTEIKWEGEGNNV